MKIGDKVKIERVTAIESGLRPHLWAHGLVGRLGAIHSDLHGAHLSYLVEFDGGYPWETSRGYSSLWCVEVSVLEPIVLPKELFEI
jgi:hypothetical protein